MQMNLYVPESYTIIEFLDTPCHTFGVILTEHLEINPLIKRYTRLRAEHEVKDPSTGVSFLPYWYSRTKEEAEAYIKSRTVRDRRNKSDRTFSVRGTYYV